jgi:hypothetical protein
MAKPTNSTGIDDVEQGTRPEAEVVLPPKDRTDGLFDGLLDEGVDRSKADEIAATLRANASTGRAPQEVAPQANASVGAVHEGIVAPDAVENETLEGLLAKGSGIGIGNTELREREVQDEELVSTQLEGLISGDSKFIRNARLRGVELANARGQLGSSFAAGAAERAAIESALPIAQADAQAYRDVASQNMNAWNTFALANLQRATTLDTALLSANTQINLANMDTLARVSMANLQASTQTNIANLDARTRTNVANLQASTSIAVQNLQSRLQFSMQSRTLTHDAGMEQLKQAGRVDLAMLDGEIRARLLNFEIDGKIELSQLDHEEMLQVNEIIQGYNMEKQNDQQAFEGEMNRNNMLFEADRLYVQQLEIYSTVDMDADAANALKAELWNSHVARRSMINDLFPGLDPIPVEPNSHKGGIGVYGNSG